MFSHSVLAFAVPVAAAPIPEGGGTGTWQGLIIYITIAIGISFLCSILEAILLSTSVSFVESGVEQGKRSAVIMQNLKENIERPIAAILTLNTLAHTIGAAGAGAEAVAIFGDELFGIITLILTLMILVFSEIIPKTIGAAYWKPLNGIAAYIIRMLVWILFPLVWLLEQTTRLIGSPAHAPSVSRMELEAMTRLGEQEGALGEQEGRIVRNLLQLRNVQVWDIMTPRTVVLAFQRNKTVAEVLEKYPTLPYSRIPIFGENTDDVSGFVLRQDIFEAYAADEEHKTLQDFCREIKVIPESASVANAMEQFMTDQQHILLVIDEYGGTAGILTMEDTLETLLGIEITDESDLVTDLRKMAEQRYQRQRHLLDASGGSSLQAPVSERASESSTEEANEPGGDTPSTLAPDN